MRISTCLNQMMAKMTQDRAGTPMMKWRTGRTYFSTARVNPIATPSITPAMNAAKSPEKMRDTVIAMSCMYLGVLTTSQKEETMAGMPGTRYDGTKNETVCQTARITTNEVIGSFLPAKALSARASASPCSVEIATSGRVTPEAMPSSPRRLLAGGLLDSLFLQAGINYAIVGHLLEVTAFHPCLEDQLNVLLNY